MLYDIKKFPEGTKITQRRIIESDLHRNGDTLKYLTETKTFIDYEDVSPFISYNDLSSVVVIDKGIMQKNYVQIGDVLLGSGADVTLSTNGAEIVFDLPNCVYCSYLFNNGFSGCFNKITFRNMKNCIYREGFYYFDTKELVFDNCELKEIQYFFDTRGTSNVEKISPVVLSPSHTISTFCYSANYPKLTDFGGLINLKASITSYAFNNLPNLSYESCINILNGLYDFTGNGITPASNEGKLKVHQNFLNLVGDEISIGTNKGWTITA